MCFPYKYTLLCIIISLRKNKGQNYICRGRNHIRMNVILCFMVCLSKSMHTCSLVVASKIDREKIILLRLSLSLYISKYITLNLHKGASLIFDNLVNNTHFIQFKERGKKKVSNSSSYRHRRHSCCYFWNSNQGISVHFLFRASLFQDDFSILERTDVSFGGRRFHWLRYFVYRPV